MSLSKVDRAIKVVEYLIGEKQERIDSIGRKLNATEKEKIFVGQEIEMIKNVKLLISSTRTAFQAHLGKIPPQAADLEEAVLGAVILERAALPAIVDYLKPEHLYLPDHRNIYQACINLYNNKRPVDMRTVVFELRQMKVEHELGWPYKVADLTSKVSSAVNIEYHARIVIQMAIKRQLIDTCAKVLTDAYEDDSDALELLEDLENNLKTINEWITSNTIAK